MTFRDGRSLVFSAFVLAAVAAGCSSKPATAKAYVNASLVQGSGGGTCNFGSRQSILMIGTSSLGPLTDTNPERVDNGTTQAGSVSLDCTVSPDGSNFNIEVSSSVKTQLSGGGGSMTVTGVVNPSTGGTGLHGTFAYGGVQYDDPNCTLVFTYMGNDITLQNDAPKVATGRIWGHVDCPNASSSGSGQNFTCDASADFVFENCGG